MDDFLQPLPKERMETMLADYALGSLPDDEARQFEQSLPQYPDIEEEVRRIRTVFASFDKEEFLERQTRPARTLSVHVQERLARRRTPVFSGRSLRHLWPAVSFALLLAFLFVPGGFLSYLDNGRSATERVAVTVPAAPSIVSSVVTPDKVADIVAEETGDALGVALSVPDPLAVGNDRLPEGEIAEALGGFSISNDMAQGLAETVLSPISDYALSGALYDDLAESEVQLLLEELEKNEVL